MARGGRNPDERRGRTPRANRTRGPGRSGDVRPHLRAEPAAPLAHFAPERLAAFLELALGPTELLRLCRRLGLSSPGYRLEKLGPPQHAGLLADEYLSSSGDAEIEEAVVAALKTPALRTMWLGGAAARELAQLVSGDPVQAAARLAWRFIGDGDPSVRVAAERAVDAGLALLEREEDETTQPGVPKPGRSSDESEMARRVERAERDRTAARALLQQARVEIAERDQRLNEIRSELGALRRTNAEQSAELSRLHATRSTGERRGAQELRRLSSERARLESRMGELEERLRDEQRRRNEAESLARTRAAPDRELTPPPEPGGAQEFSLPHFTAEFYASIERWDRRVVKSAFEKVMLLARDHRHPSLRSIPLEGVPNLFRIRVATDVRLVYRRAPEGRLEILSLIDREDLERYVKQLKTRVEG